MKPTIGSTFYGARYELKPLNDPQLPVFVYGTLRPGQGNYRLLAGKTTQERTATLKDMRMVTFATGGFPYILDNPGTTVTGTLVDVHPDLWGITLASLDNLEGTPHHYERLVRTVQVDGEDVKAYVYVPPARSQRQYADMVAIESGDWFDRYDYVPQRVYGRRVPLT